MTTQTQTHTPTAVPAASTEAAGSLAEELQELAVAEQLASLTSMPSLSTLHCVTSRHDTYRLPEM